ncbi:hypothetical protein FZI91_04920 [Mycobacterium sp. CBMA271]|uniref:hypothetical protein n=1 Tax=unclassified Mycobacteroides TaxID=2618759 RepID=UPI0012DD7600|nr:MULTISPECIES: hypothetical protein [unclassified Mycobacteroides]MUM19801.1 hypothetical protein [Mycobacteroides sp. CBMA 326]MUM21042.1 hypothetical protein [Mycobacteroides sp. CBMA 271]
MSDRTVIFAALSANPDVLFVRPSREIYMQDELHEEAREQLRQLGRPPGSPYVGWHHQQSSFDKAGRLDGAQTVYFGGDLDAVRAVLAGVAKAGYLVAGGSSDQEPFFVAADAHPTAAAPHQLDALHVRLRLLTADWMKQELRDGEETLLHNVIQSEELADLHAMARAVLRTRGLLTRADIDPAAPDFRPEMLAEVGDPDAVETARQLALGDGCVLSYLRLVTASGEDPVAAGIALAEEIRAATMADPARQRERLRAVAYAIEPARKEVTQDEYPEAIRNTFLDERLPVWLRAYVALDSINLPDRQWASTTPRFADASHATAPITDVDGWLNDVDALLREANFPPSPGFDPENSVDRQFATEFRERITSKHADGVRAILADPLAREPALAVALQLLHTEKLLRASDLDPLRKTWKKRLFVKPDTYTPAAPAIVTFLGALIEFSDPLGDSIAQVVLADTRKWSAPIRQFIQGLIAADQTAVDELWEIVATTGNHEAAQAYCLARARLEGISPTAVAADSIERLPKTPKYLRSCMATPAIAFADGTPLWARHYYNDMSLRRIDAALRVAADPTLPVAIRREAQRMVGTSAYLEYPDSRHWSQHPADVVALAERRVALGDITETVAEAPAEERPSWVRRIQNSVRRARR